jgi:hypothetical protein
MNWNNAPALWNFSLAFAEKPAIAAPCGKYPAGAASGPG